MNTLIKYTNAVERRICGLRCQIRQRRSPNPIAAMGQPHVSLFFDYEGKWSRPDQEINSAKGIAHVLDKIEQTGIKATFNCVGRLADDQGDMLRQISQSGHEIASHTVRHTVVKGWSTMQMKDDIIEFKKLLNPASNHIAGFRPPQSKWRFKTLQALLDEGILWDAADDPAPFPYIIAKKGDRRLWRMPTRIDDWNLEKDDMKPSAMLTAWQSAVTSAIINRRYVAVGFHPWILGKSASRLAAFSDFIDSLFDLNDIAIQPFGEIARLCEAGVAHKKTA